MIKWFKKILEGLKNLLRRTKVDDLLVDALIDEAMVDIEGMIGKGLTKLSVYFAENMEWLKRIDPKSYAVIREIVQNPGRKKVTKAIFDTIGRELKDAYANWQK